MARRSSVKQMVREVVGDEKFQARVERQLDRQRMGKVLFALRTSNGITQEEMAKRLRISQSKVSKIEHTDDVKMRLGDLMAYTDALDVQMSVFFHKTAVDRVKFHAFQIKQNLDQLTALAQEDKVMLDGVAQFYGETLNNFLRLFQKSVVNLDVAIKKTSPAPLEVTSSIGDIATDESDGTEADPTDYTALIKQ